ncbi:MAG: hypothetical protein FJ286_13845, partial [Planctomycetes bacterium]|nr:hypothetical protein [Planctomycetota bacterium]
MFDTELYQQVLGLTTPWKVTDVRLDVESTEIHVHVEHPEGCRRELLSRVVFRGPESGGVLQDTVGEDSSFENKNDLVMRVESSPA